MNPNNPYAILDDVDQIRADRWARKIHQIGQILFRHSANAPRPGDADRLDRLMAVTNTQRDQLQWCIDTLNRAKEIFAGTAGAAEREEIQNLLLATGYYGLNDVAEIEQFFKANGERPSDQSQN